MLASRSSSPDNDVFNISTSLVPERPPVTASTTAVTFDTLDPPSPPIMLHQDLQEGCGGQLWPAGMVLAEYFLQTFRSKSLLGQTIAEIGAGSGLVGLAVALGCRLDRKLYITDQKPMLSLMQTNIALNGVGGQVEALVFDWGTSPPSAVLGDAGHPDIVLAADCVYFEPAFPLLLHTLQDLIGPTTTCYFCFKKRRKADMRFIRDMKKKFAVALIGYDQRDRHQREGIYLYTVRHRSSE